VNATRTDKAGKKCGYSSACENGGGRQRKNAHNVENAGISKMPKREVHRWYKKEKGTKSPDGALQGKEEEMTREQQPLGLTDKEVRSRKSGRTVGK